jgi:hypothetical protein
MSDISWEDNLWTDATRAAYLEAGEAAIEAFRAHQALVAGASSDADEDAIDESAETVRLAFVAVSDAEFAYSSTVAPFSLLEDEDDEDEDEDDDSVDSGADHTKISIMLRRDFDLTSEAALILAGRKAAAAAPSDRPVDIPDQDVAPLARAIFQIVQSGGVDALNDVDGIQPVVGVVLAVGREELLTEDDVDALLEEDPGELFAGEGEVIYSQSEVWS